ncbi:hypothetical protein MGYG_08412 [Nannizzia gypsea CBS 118893]|uniref:Uncharacterized protein n=1 Tax=Arthroderma gypseum (strain ATCC MYA-4604 / CBS 118893) TaxID=535722 RepID=E4V5M5_ARTGP|nr:hypothetical protein MGYG_08412 [Nannizzia gypsea CBS 118893]EFR05400.1 hypothetical protein MGYG_08412 [Nannizzia gypsea CBS 118893]
MAALLSSATPSSIHDLEVDKTMRLYTGRPPAIIPILVCLQATSARPISLSERAGIDSLNTLRSIDDQPKRERGIIDLEKKVKLLIGLCAGLGGLLFISLISYLVVHKMWYRKLFWREKASRQVRDNGVSSSTHPDFPCHPLYREGIRAASTQTSPKLPEAQSPATSSPFRYHPYNPQPPNSYFQPVEVYQTLMLPGEILETRASQTPGSGTNLPTSRSSQDELSTTPQGRTHAVDAAAHPVPITHLSQLPIHSPQPRRIGLPVSPKLQ